MYPIWLTVFNSALFLSSVLLFLAIRSDDLGSLTHLGSSPKRPAAQSGLSQLCRQTTWTDGLWLHCHSRCGDKGGSFCGGLTNARNRFQTCVRLAIDLGAGVLIPPVMARSKDNLGNTNAETVCPNHWWNTKYFESEMQRQCPQLKVRLCEASVNGSRVLDMPYRSNHEEPSHCKTTFRNMVNADLLRSDILPGDITSGNPVLIQYGDPMFTWNYSRSNENPTVRKDLINTIRNNQSLVKMAEEILSYPQLDGGFFGIHLRAEADVPASWGPPEVQMARYVDSLLGTREEISEDVSTVYVSSGDQAAIDTFRQLLTPHNVTVYDKWSLLEGDTERLDRLDSFGFDQKGAVDYEVLRNSTYFLGHWKSTMSLLLAYQRTMEKGAEKFFNEYINPESSEPKCCDRTFAESMTIRGDRYTKLFVVDGADYMDIFP
jgi:hypothetical protein